ncbi:MULTISPECIES: hypothetical protein [Photobacterium]|uniref:hypothetical protein n=1 Tax=Photobacterium TaxID=657 RepID=UPI001E53BC37|nr:MULTISPECIES: hypothetical protein [Photobacterium]MCD9485918.1 hypothetical protein [Photobacterium iliopiscarium]MCF2242615.1 hypothetical protein [Photobacterium iliopiscarium]
MIIIPVNSVDPKTKERFIGISLSVWPKCGVAVFLGILLILTSCIYHSILYSYTMPTWAPWGAIAILALLSMRWRLSMSEDGKTLLRQLTIFSIAISQTPFKCNGEVKRIHLMPSGLRKNQYYILFVGPETKVSLHYCIIPEEKKRLITYQISSMFNLEMPEN